jgi:uncharacterized protein
MSLGADLTAILSADPLRWEALRLARSLALPDCWIAAGFVRDAVWDHLHGRPPGHPAGDVDVIWYDPARPEAETDRAIEQRPRGLSASFAWSVKNQARMHRRNGDPPYASAADAMRSWPETATAVAVRLSSADMLEINAPFGLDDLFGLRLVPTAAFLVRKRALFEQRVADKAWLCRYPLLQPA